MDLTRSYAEDNIRWTTQKAKNRSNGKSIVIISEDKITEFPSARKAELEMKLPRGVLSRALREGKKYKKLRVVIKH
jgi:hypothetical protein